MSAWAACRVPAPSEAERIAELAERSLVLEIETYPKPGPSVTSTPAVTPTWTPRRSPAAPPCCGRTSPSWPTRARAMRTWPYCARSGCVPSTRCSPRPVASTRIAARSSARAAVCGCRSARDAGDDAGRNDARCVRLPPLGCRDPRRPALPAATANARAAATASAAHVARRPTVSRPSMRSAARAASRAA